MQALYVLGLALLSLWALWYLYVLLMGLYRAKLAHKLTKTAYLLSLPALIIGFVLDLVINWTVAAAWFRQWPQRPFELVTDRLSRYMGADAGWQKVHAMWICTTLLDYFDPHDKHCE